MKHLIKLIIIIALVCAAYYAGANGGFKVAYENAKTNIESWVNNFKGFSIGESNESENYVHDDYIYVTAQDTSYDEIKEGIKETYYKELTVLDYKNISNKSGKYDVIITYKNEDDEKCKDKLTLCVCNNPSKIKVNVLSHDTYSNQFSLTIKITNLTDEKINKISFLYMNVADSDENELCSAMFKDIDVTILANGSETHTLNFNYNYLTDYYKENYKKYIGSWDTYFYWLEII